MCSNPERPESAQSNGMVAIRKYIFDIFGFLTFGIRAIRYFISR